MSDDRDARVGAAAGSRRTLNHLLAVVGFACAGASFCTGMSVFAIVILLILAAAVSRDYRCERSASSAE